MEQKLNILYIIVSSNLFIITKYIKHNVGRKILCVLSIIFLLYIKLDMSMYSTKSKIYFIIFFNKIGYNQTPYV